MNLLPLLRTSSVGPRKMPVLQDSNLIVGSSSICRHRNSQGIDVLLPLCNVVDSINGGILQLRQDLCWLTKTEVDQSLQEQVVGPHKLDHFSWLVQSAELLNGPNYQLMIPDLLPTKQPK